MKAARKNTIREITKSKSRFLSILLICAIGVGFFSGVRASGFDMRISADDYYDKYNLFDLRVLSTFGLTDDDLAAIKEIDDVDEAYASKYTDLIMYVDDKEFVSRVYSELPDEVNTIDLYKGRKASADKEIIINCYSFSDRTNLGDTAAFVDPTNAKEFPLKNDEYTIVGMYHTPMYVSISQRGSTNIGDGVIDALLILPEEQFTQEPYTEIYIRSNKLKDAQSYSKEYEKLRDKISDKLEELGKDRSTIRYEEVLGDAMKEIADGEKELEQAKKDGQKELDDAKRQLDDAKTEIADGEKKLADSKKQIDEGKPQLEDAKKQLESARRELDKGKKELADSKKLLDDTKAQLDEAKKQLDNGEAQLKAGEKELADAKKQLDDAEEEIKANKVLIESGKKELEAGKKELEEKEEEFNRVKRLLEEAEQVCELARKGVQRAEDYYKREVERFGEDSLAAAAALNLLDIAKSGLDTANTAKKQIEDMIPPGAEEELAKAKTLIAEKEKELADGEKQIADAEKQVAEGRKKYAEGYEEYKKNSEKFADSKNEFEDGYKKYSDGLQLYIDGYEQFAKGEREYETNYALFSEKSKAMEDGIKQYEEGLVTLANAKKDYEQGLVDYEDGVHEFRRKTEDAERELTEAKEKIADAGNAQWYIFRRDDNQGYAEYESNAERIDRIAAIFPLFFLLVAGLVCLTTMSRMVEEQRTQIGTLKALGYSRGVIMKHYMSYAVTAALAGGVGGAIGGCFLFPSVIIYAYGMMYKITDIHYTFTPENMILSIGSMTLAIALTVYFSCSSALKETPASLMRPKAPKAGKRIFLEKTTFIWNKMNFFAKVTARNLIRYKRRMFMTIVGIAGCTALSLTGFGLKNSIMDIVSLQYDSIYKYSGFAAYKDDIKPSEMATIYDTLRAYNKDTTYTRALVKQYAAEFSGKNINCYVTVAEDSDIFETFIDMRERKSGEKVTMRDGAVVTEKTARMLGAKVGDEITVKVSDGINKKVTIASITEQYVSNYIYLSESEYRNVFGAPPKYNMVYFYNGMTGDDEEAFSEHILANGNVITVVLNSKSHDSIYNTLKIMDLVVIVLIGAAAALAFVVLYNLSNVNITERIREIATLKVLGFYDGEVSNYVFRENIVLSLLGGLVGLGLGYALCMFVITTAEIDEVMFGRRIHALSYLWAFLITIAFSLIVNLIMTRVLKKVSMVESLKSVE